jgi:MFS family permease
VRAARSPVVILMAVLLFINYVDRGNLATAAHLMQGDLHLDYAQMGMLLSAFSWTYAWTQIPVGWLAERYGAHRMLAAGLTLWASATLFIGFAHTFTALLVLRLLLGLGESAGFPGVYAMSEILAGPRASGRWVGIQNSLGNLPGIIAPWLTGSIIQSTGHYTNAFVVAAAVSVLGLVGWVGMVPKLGELQWKFPARAIGAGA